MNTGKKVLVGAGMAVFLTAASFVAPGGMLGSDQGETPAGVVRPTPSASPGVEPFPAEGTVPVVAPSAESSESASGEIGKSSEEKTRKSGESAPSASPSAVRSASRVSASLTTTAAKKKPKPKVTTFKDYSFCGWSVKEAQRCIDRGKLTRYKPSGVNTLAGHNYMGWYWIDDLPVGRKVVIKSGELRGTYKVYGHAKVYNKKFPRSGLGADVALQTCEDSGIGFSFLRRV